MFSELFFQNAQNVQVRFMGLPVWALCMVGAAALALLLHYFFFLRRAEFGFPAAPVVLRLLTFLVIIALLAHPVFFYDVKKNLPRRVGMILDASQSMGLKDKPGGPTRFANSVEQARRVRSGLKDSRVWLFSFSDKIAPTDFKALRKNTPLGKNTYLLDSVKNADTGEGLSFTDLVVFSDGRDNSGLRFSDDPALPRIHTVGAGPVRDDVNISVGDIQIPEYSFVKQPVSLRGDLHIAGMPEGAKILVEPYRNTSESEILKNKSGQAVRTYITSRGRSPAGHRFAFDIFPQETGMHVITVRARRSDRAVQEDVLEDNARTVFIDVVSGFDKILILDAPRWDYAFLNRILQPRKKVELESLLLTKQGPRGNAKRNAISSVTALSDYALVIVGSVGRPTAAERTALFQYLQNGGSVIVLGGPESLFTMNDASWGRIIKKLKAPADMEPFSPRLTQAGRSNSLTRVAGDALAAAEQWASLPDLRTYYPVAPPAGGEVLAEHPGARCGGAACPLIIQARSGRGRVLMLPFQGFWRWRLAHKPDDTLDTFFNNAVTMLLQREDTRPVRLFMPDRYFQLGEQIRFEARVSKTIAATPAPRLIIKRLGREQVAELKMIKSRDTDEFYSAEFIPETKDVYTAEVVAGRDSSGAEPFDVDIARAEFLLTSQDSGFLKKISGATKGEYVTKGRIDKFIKKLNEPDQYALVRTETHLYRSPLCYFVLGLLMLLLMLEWIVRRRGGLT